MRILATWNFTVDSLMCSSCAIARFRCPSASRANTSSSRSPRVVSGSGAGSWDTRSGIVADTVVPQPSTASTSSRPSSTSSRSWTRPGARASWVRVPGPSPRTVARSASSVICQPMCTRVTDSCSSAFSSTARTIMRAECATSAATVRPESGAPHSSRTGR
ncbi:hypothetical protein [Streptomyces sp. NPDC020742]|uniref:hypothetical protein n=1 Tax=unclassified Streptomyces TaxID=2593676 RepID=UPI0033D20F1A